MGIQEKETLIAEIERFKEEAMKSYVVSCWAESYTNYDPFGYVVLENENNKVWWLKTQAYQLWEMWQAAKAQDDQKIKILLCDDHLKKCESPTGIFNSQYPDEEPCLICLAKQARAQAVPEGFVLVPMVPSERMINAVRQCYEGEAYLPYSLYSEFVNQAIIERMEAQEPAND